MTPDDGQPVDMRPEDEPTFKPPKCSDCGRERDPLNRQMDSYDYSPIQAITGQPFGWYNGKDAGEGDMCPECFTKLFKMSNGIR